MQIGNSAARAAALASGGVDGAVVTAGFIPAAKRAGLGVIFDLSTISIKFANAIVIANTALINERPGVVKASMAAVIEGIRSWRATSDAAKAFLKKSYNLPDAEIDDVYGEVSRLVRPEPTPDLIEIKMRGTAFQSSRRAELWISGDLWTQDSLTKFYGSLDEIHSSHCWHDRADGPLPQSRR